MIPSARITAFVAFFAFVAPAQGEQLVLTVAPGRIAISSNYNGDTVIVFGAIQIGNPPVRPYDMVLTVTGPREAVLARRKGRIAGIWINQGSRTFNDIPSFLAILTNRPFAAIAGADRLRRERVGLKNALLVDGAVVDDGDPYLANLVSIRRDEKLFSEHPAGVTFLSPTAFRAEIPLPNNVSIGSYSIDLKLFSRGTPVAHETSSFQVVKVGIEEFVVKAAVDNGLIYGLATMMMALFTGWLASIAFRRD